MVVDPNNQHYYDLGAPAPAPAPWYKRREVQQKLFIGVLVGLLVVFVGVRIYMSVTFDAVEEDTRTTTEALLEQASARCAEEKDPEACMNEARTATAEATGSSIACEGMRGQELKNCAQLIALDTGDAKVCDVIENDGDRADCADAAYLVKAKADSDYALCSSITSTDLRESCESQVGAPIIAAGECAKYGIDEDLCSTQEAIDEVIASGDPRGCATFATFDRESCEDYFTSIDADFDGLTAFREYELGTSDANADTDDDGYEDGAEVAAGYDPLK